ncbi:hypothetical protein DQ04_04651050 [Trypanosoma grayi]|uniref:hypothetical protein n=1 Tax=Trypanosoma grayi TaxID=71804 RepID=UPI0004F4744F|nr:hypothetical protein DQ04_04651050 [Trypanosoma grayi]KEG09785.1 hypothetical protein DQ04_04651050 [Trypanosoma grayi]
MGKGRDSALEVANSTIDSRDCEMKAVLVSFNHAMHSKYNLILNVTKHHLVVVSRHVRQRCVQEATHGSPPYFLCLRDTAAVGEGHLVEKIRYPTTRVQEARVQHHTIGVVALHRKLHVRVSCQPPGVWESCKKL